MDGTYYVFETLGLYDRVGMEADGRWIWERTSQYPNNLSADEQETLLKTAILKYFTPYLS